MFRLFFVAFLALSENLLLEFGQAPYFELPVDQEEFTLISWNIYKGNKDGLYFDLQQMARCSDFLLMQEFILNPEQENLMATVDESHWAFAKSFEDSGGWTGVATMSRWQPTVSVPVQSPGTEPFAGTPKMSLISQYKMAGQELWIVNLHGLNFDITHSDFKEQIDDIVLRLKNYKGALIFAGDFNTWSDSRRKHLIKRMEELGLVRVDIEKPMGVFSATLDHIFYRGIVVLDYGTMDEVETSDHFPLYIKYKMQPPTLSFIPRVILSEAKGH